jgi:ABC-2 type transport system ATP-binding protein
VDPTTLEVDVKAGQSLNEIFGYLTDHHIEVVSLKNKINRLEEMFLSLVGTSTHES